MQILTAFLDCPECQLTFEATWADDSLDLQDMPSAPVATHTCPACGHQFTQEYPGWSLFTEAG